MRIAFTHNVQRTESEEEAEFDSPETIAAITQALEQLGHVVETIDVQGSVQSLITRLEGFRPDLILNTAEGNKGRVREGFYPALFEQLGFPVTGGDAFSCTVTLDKRLSKMMVAAWGVPTPRSVFVEGPGADLSDLRMPVIVKPNFEGSSKGIGDDAVVTDAGALAARVADALARYPDGVLVEEFIVGHDVTVPYIEGVAPATGGVLPPAEYLIDASAGAREHRIYDFRLKHDQSFAVQVRVPAQLPAETMAELVRYTQLVHRALGVRDFGRSDFRIDREGKVWFLEVNALPSLEPGASIYESAALAGVGDMSAVLSAILASACRRHGIDPQPRAVDQRPVRVGLVYNLKRVKPTADGGNDHEAEYDAQETIDAWATALASHGHEVVRVEATSEQLSRLAERRLDVVFNMSEGLRGRAREALVPAWLEHHGIAFTGSSAVTMALALDKGLAKRLVREAGVPTAPFALMLGADDPLPEGLGWPVIVKPVAEGSSKGVSGPSVARTEAELRDAVRRCVERYGQGALVEGFLSGREFTVGILQDADGIIEVLPPMEIVFATSAGPDPIYRFEHKLEFHSDVQYVCPAEQGTALGEELVRVAQASFVALGCRDVSRVDLRLDAAGRVNFIECNPLPGLTPGWSDLCLIARAAGMSYEALIGRILDPAIRRWRRGEV